MIEALEGRTLGISATCSTFFFRSRSSALDRNGFARHHRICRPPFFLDVRMRDGPMNVVVT